MPDQAQGTTGKIEKDEANPDHSPTTEAIMIHTEASLDHNTGKDTVTTKAAPNNLTQPTEDTAIDLAMTHHTSRIIHTSHLFRLLIPRS